MVFLPGLAQRGLPAPTTHQARSPTVCDSAEGPLRARLRTTCPAVPDHMNVTQVHTDIRTCLLLAAATRTKVQRISRLHPSFCFQGSPSGLPSKACGEGAEGAAPAPLSSPTNWHSHTPAEDQGRERKQSKQRSWNIGKGRIRRGGVDSQERPPTLVLPTPSLALQLNALSRPWEPKGISSKAQSDLRKGCRPGCLAEDKPRRSVATPAHTHTQSLPAPPPHLVQGSKKVALYKTFRQREALPEGENRQIHLC